MKVAIVHDYLNQYGGAERVLETLLEIFPQAHLYTLIYSPHNGVNGKFKNYVKKTSFLDFKLVHDNHRPFIPLMPLAAASLNLGNQYDLIISATAGYAKGIRHGGKSYHLSYCYTPLRYAWEMDNYFESRAFKTFFRPAFAYLKAWDRRAGQRPNKIVAISNFIAKKVKEYYGRDASVVYPPVDVKKFYYDERKAGRGGYYLAVGRLLHYKRFDLAIEAFRELGLPLKIVGIGPEEGRLKGRTSGWWTKNIELVNFVDDDELRRLYQGAKALVFPQVEDFGLVAAEALSCGTPVIAFRGGGATEIVEDGSSGVFFEKQSAHDVVSAVKRFGRMRFKRREISRKAERFSAERFKKQFLAEIPGAAGEV